MPRKTSATESVEDAPEEDVAIPTTMLESEPRMTSKELLEFLKDYSPFGEENDPYEILNNMLGADWTFRVVNTTQAKSFSHLIVAGELAIRVKDSMFGGLLRSGLAIVPMTYPYQPLLQVGIKNALLNALSQLGATVEYAEFEDQEPTTPSAPPPAAKSGAGSAPKNVKQFAKKPAATAEGGAICEDCGSEIEGYEARSGKWVPPAMQVRMTTNDYGVPLCRACSAQRFKASR